MKTYFVLGHRVTPLFTVGDYSLIESVSAPKVPGPPPHSHDGASEFFYVAVGQLDVMVDGEWQTMVEGDSVCLKPGQVHTFINNSESDARWITGWSPRGFEKFFTDFGVEIERPGALEESVSDEVIKRVLAKSREYGMTVPD